MFEVCRVWYQMKGNLISSKDSDLHLPNKHFYKRVMHGRKLFPAMTFLPTNYWVNVCYYSCLKLNFLSFDTKHDMLWTMLRVNNIWHLIIKFAQPLTQLTFWSKCWHPNLPIVLEIRLDTNISQIKPNFVILFSI